MGLKLLNQSFSFSFGNWILITIYSAVIVSNKMATTSLRFEDVLGS